MKEVGLTVIHSEDMIGIVISREPKGFHRGKNAETIVLSIDEGKSLCSELQKAIMKAEENAHAKNT